MSSKYPVNMAVYPVDKCIFDVISGPLPVDKSKRGGGLWIKLSTGDVTLAILFKKIKKNSKLKFSISKFVYTQQPPTNPIPRR